MRPLTYVILVGLFFALLQSSYFFLMAIYLTSAYPSFLAVTIGWLIGVAIGLRVGSWGGDHVWLGLSLVAYFACQVLLKQVSYETALLPVCGLFVAVSGAHSGAFFRNNRETLGTVGRLFFWENNGFLAGWIFGFFGFVLLGPMFHWLAPVGLAVVVAAAKPRRQA
jgi:hypothetical protein